MYGWSWRAKLEVIVIKAGPDECWRSDPSKCSIDPDGYAHFAAADTSEHLVHRAAVVADGREIPVGWEVDHVAGVCRYRDCANPAHLEAVPKKENLRRAGVSRVRAITCARGHSREDAYGDGSCRSCKREDGYAKVAAGGFIGKRKAQQRQARRDAIARFAAEGLRDTDIAQMLDIHPATVNYYKKTMSRLCMLLRAASGRCTGGACGPARAGASRTCCSWLSYGV